jgi:hypothetical protein
MNFCCLETIAAAPPQKQEPFPVEFGKDKWKTSNNHRIDPSQPTLKLDNSQTGHGAIESANVRLHSRNFEVEVCDLKNFDFLDLEML